MYYNVVSWGNLAYYILVVILWQL